MVMKKIEHLLIAMQCLGEQTVVSIYKVDGPTVCWLGVIMLTNKH